MGKKESMNSVQVLHSAPKVVQFPPKMNAKKRLTSAVLGTAILSMSLLFSPVAEAKFINTFIIKIGGKTLVKGEEAKLARHDIIFANKFHYDDIRYDTIRSNTWKSIKALNSAAQIFVSTNINFVDPHEDSFQAMAANTLARYNVSRGHSMGSLNGNNPELFLKDTSGRRLQANYGDYMIDFGHYAAQDYAGEATVADHVAQPWTADGVYSDHCFAVKTGFVPWPAKYNTDVKWSAAMNGMVSSVSGALAARGQKLAANRGPTTTPEAYNAWLNLDNTATPPAVVLEEAAFAVGYGPGHINFFPEPTWKRQVDLLSQIDRSKVCFLASSDLLTESASGTDNWGDQFTFYDALWYSIGSYLIGKNDVQNNSYFAFVKGTSTYNNLDIYYDEYSKLNLGRAIGTYNVSNYGGTNIYWREFQYGYVYVNPTPRDVSSIPLLESCRQLSHATLSSSPSSLPAKGYISLNAHRAAILLKVAP